MKRIRPGLIVPSLVAAVMVAAFSFLTPPASAALVDPPHLERLFMRHTVAAASQANWNLPLYNAAFTDSSCFRNTAGTVLSNNDTTVAIPVANLPIPEPTRNPVVLGIQADSLYSPWVTLYVRANNSVSGVTWAGTTTLDSVYVSAQWSHDGATWADADATPTRAFFAANVSPTTLIALSGIEQTNLAPVAISFPCVQGVLPVTDPINIGKNLCMCGGFIRFIINTGAGTGQYSADLLHW